MGERHDNYKTSTQERLSVLKRCVYWLEIFHNGGCQGTARRTARKHFLSFGCFTILLHRNVKLLYKYVGRLAIIFYGYEGICPNKRNHAAYAAESHGPQELKV